MYVCYIFCTVRFQIKAAQRQQELKLAQQLLRQQEGQKAAIQQQLNQVSFYNHLDILNIIAVSSKN